MPSIERRKEPRVAVQLPLRFVFAGKTVDTRIVDLSNSGVRFHTPDALPVMTRMQISLELPDDEEGAGAPPIAMTGVVIRCAQVRGHGQFSFDAAIFFEDVSPTAGARLKRFVRKQLAPADRSS